PLDSDLINRLSQKFDMLVSIEEHSLIGGLGSSIAEFLIDNRKQNTLLRFGTQDRFPHLLGSQEFIRTQNKLTPVEISNQIHKEYQKLCTHLQQY
ncbi:MAG: hypothetical protein FJZ57_07300, partial [Chlamydiae bacterium]|nr:hypothetical protein [Chlamydiota bacterium]